jgi:hypothetical protein
LRLSQEWASIAALERALLEDLALEVRRRAGIEDDDLERAPRMALRLLGPGSLAVAKGMRCPGRLTRFGDAYVIVVRPDAWDLNFTIAHEIAHWALLEIAKVRLPRDREERAANYLGAAILAPRLTVLRAHGIWAEQIPKMAREFGLSKTGMVLRLGEVRGDERAIVTRTGNVLLRSQGSFPWGDVPIIEIARDRAAEHRLAKTSFRGGIDEGRVSLRVR